MDTTVLASVISGLAGVVASYVGIQWKIKKDLEAKFDASLRALRLQAYPPLWGLVKPLALFGRDGYPGINDLVTLSKSLRDWYFDQGGLYLSETSRNAYFGLQRSLGVLAASDNWSNESLNNLDPETFEHLRLIASRLRTMLTLDVGTRNPFTFDANASRVDAAKPMRPDPKDVDERWIARNWGPHAKQHEHA
jgi:hypothetical protein